MYSFFYGDMPFFFFFYQGFLVSNLKCHVHVDDIPLWYALAFIDDSRDFFSSLSRFLHYEKLYVQNTLWETDYEFAEYDIRHEEESPTYNAIPHIHTVHQYNTRYRKKTHNNFVVG